MLYANALGPMLGRCAHLSRAGMEARLSQYEVTPVQTHVLLYLIRHGGQAPQCQVTDFLKVKPSTANGILDRMVEKDLVVRSVSGSDAGAGSSPSPTRAGRSRRCLSGVSGSRRPPGPGADPPGDGAVPLPFVPNYSEFGGGSSHMTKYMRPYAGWIALGIGCSAAEAIFELLIPLVMSDIVDVGIATGDQSYILQKGILMVVMAMVSLAFGLGGRCLLRHGRHGFRCQLAGGGVRPHSGVCLLQY